MKGGKNVIYIIKKMKEYNKKINYLICKYIIAKNLKIEDEQIWRDIYNEKKPPKTNEQKMMMKCKNIFAYINKKEFNKKEIINCYKLMANETINENNLCFSINDNAFDILLAVLEYNIFPLYNDEMAKIIFNFKLIYNGEIPLIVYQSQLEQIKKTLIINKKNCIYELYKIINRTNHFNIKHRLISFNEIKTKILEIKDILLASFSVKHLYIFGSYSKNEINEYSDLDVFIKVKRRKKKDINNKYYIFSYLEKALGIPIDGKTNDKDYKKSKLKKDMKKNLKKIY